MTDLVNRLWKTHPYLAQIIYLVYMKVKGQ